MTTTKSFKDIITLPEWRPLSNITPAVLNSPIPGSGSYIVGDLRNNEDRHPIQYYVNSSTTIYAYNIKNDGAYLMTSPALTTFGSGSGLAFSPSYGPSGVLAAGSTATDVVISTAFASAVGANQLANRGDGRGYKIRIIGNAGAGSSGKIEERLIVGNTLGTQPTITLDSALSFTPAAGDGYEILSGRVYLFGSNGAAGFKYYDTATNTYSAALVVANAPTTSGDGNLIALDELHVPYTREPGEGFLVGAGTYNGALLKCLTATAAGATSLTGETTAGDYTVLQNEYRNFQLRIVEDIGTPAAVGQRRRITSHTAGINPVYTVSAWTTQPSATAKFVIENDRDKLIYWGSGAPQTYCYNIAANTWDSTTFASRTQNVGSGLASVHGFGIVPDTAKNARHSYFYSFRGGANNTLDLFDIAGAATGAWTLGITYLNQGQNFGGGNSYTYCPASEGGRYFYIDPIWSSGLSTSQNFYRFDVQNRVIESWATIPFLPSTYNNSLTGNRLASTIFVDGAVKISFINYIPNSSNASAGIPFWQCLITR